MNISQRGLDLIKEFEGYLRPLKDGGCIAYKCPAGVLTIGWGCTKGVKAGMTWTRDEATEGLRRELDECEDAVTRMVTVPINQHEFDALVSFAYNCGTGALRKSTILRKLNKGDRTGAAAAFMMWDKAKVNGKMTALRGLTRRRSAERALFLEAPPEAPEPELMPQAVEPPKDNTNTVVVGTTAVAGAGVIGPEAIAQLAPLSSNLVQVKDNAATILSGGPMLAGLILIAGLGVCAWLVWRELKA